MQERKRREEEAAKLAAANKAKADAAAAVSVAMQSVIAFVVCLRTGVIHLSVWIYLSIYLASVVGSRVGLSSASFAFLLLWLSCFARILG